MPADFEPSLKTTHPKARLSSWLSTVDHKRLGILYLLLALFWILIGGIEAAVIRMQLIRPNNDFISPQIYNRLFTMHGTTMIFFVAMPMVFGFANYLVPLMIGARDTAFPRVNAFSLWMTAFGGLILYASFLGGGGPLVAGDAPSMGWFAYAPLTSPTFSPGHSTDFWTLGLLVSGFGSIGSAINIVATIVCLRCPGMTLRNMPLFVWMNLVTSCLVIMSISPLTAAQLMLLVDRYLGGHFFDTQSGGSAVLWMHFFWIFGHPEVYVLVLPAFAIASEVIPVFFRKVIFGYPAMVGATVAIGFIGMSVWAHHMFTVGLGAGANTFFVLTTMVIAIPTGIKIFNWLATLWGGDLQFRLPLLFCLAFLFQFLIAGLTGIMLGVAPFDWQLSGSYFVVAHFHYVIVGGILFCFFAGFYYWFPKVSGRMLNERLGRWQFWLFVLGFHLTFDFMHVPGLLGMPRRTYTYEVGREWAVWNGIMTVGVVFQAFSLAIFVVNLFLSYFRGKVAGNDPWDAWTLEWSTHSPPLSYNFRSVPVVRSRRPLWDLKHPEDPDWRYEPAEPFLYADSPAVKEVDLPASTPWPLLLALGLALMASGLVSDRNVSLVGIVVALASCVGWFRNILPREKHEKVPAREEEPVSTTRSGIAQRHDVTGDQHRARVPVERHPFSAGALGGVAGGLVMLVCATLWSAFTHKGPWYAANLVAAGFFPTRVTTEQLMAFHWASLLIGVSVSALAAILIGLLYGAALPMLPKHPIVLSVLVLPLIGSGLVYVTLGPINPELVGRVDWFWFVAAQLAIGAVVGFVVSRRERIHVWQHAPERQREGADVF